MSAESTKEATAEGHKVTTVVEGAEATAAAPEEVASPPESVAIFFDGEPMAGKAETWMTGHVADEATLQFVGPHALPLPLFDKAGFGGAITNLATSFPDLTFNATKVAPTKQEDGSWAADIVVTGTHTGAAYTPIKVTKEDEMLDLKAISEAQVPEWPQDSRQRGSRGVDDY